MDPKTSFTVDLSSYAVVGFHATSELAFRHIERVGFLPSKVLSNQSHSCILRTACVLGIETGSYREWLGMRSVTFAKNLNDAISHAKKGFAGGQGANQIIDILQSISDHGDFHQKGVAAKALQEIELFKQSPSIICAVNLSSLKDRLVEDRYSPYYHFYCHPDVPVPKVSEIGPSLVIDKLNIT